MPSLEPSPADHAASVRRYFSRPENYLAKDFIVRIREDIIGEALTGLPPGTVLDVGCGDGRLGAMFLSRGHRVTFLDLSPAMLALARKQVSIENADRAEFIEGTLDSIPAGRRFDLVLCLGVVAHVGSAEGTLESIARVAVPGAQIAIQITDAGSLIGRVSSRYHAWRERRFHSHGYRLNELTLQDLLSRAAERGLKVNRTFRYSLILPGMMRVLPNWLLYSISALSRIWPLRLMGGEVIALFVRQ